MAKILAFAGSARRDSVNRQLLLAAAEACRRQDGELTVIDLRDFPQPLYDGDLEEAEGIPEHSRRLYDLMLEHSGLLLACPEYNSSITPLLKNTIDWLSRRREGDPPLAAFRGKTAGLVSASPGALGGLRGLVHVRSILGNIGVTVVPTQVAVSQAGEAFDEEGGLSRESDRQRLDSFAQELVRTVTALA